MKENKNSPSLGVHLVLGGSESRERLSPASSEAAAMAPPRRTFVPVAGRPELPLDEIRAVRSKINCRE